MLRAVRRPPEGSGTRRSAREQEMGMDGGAAQRLDHTAHERRGPPWPGNPRAQVLPVVRGAAELIDTFYFGSGWELSR